MRESIEVFTDGACLGNPGPGGWAWAVPEGRFASGAEAHTTNQRMEIHAVLDAVRTLDGPVEVVSDSTYVVNCFRDRWWESWIARGWLTSAKKPVANRDLWEPLIAGGPTGPGPDRVPVGEGAQRRCRQRPRRPAGGGGGAYPAGAYRRGRRPPTWAPPTSRGAEGRRRGRGHDRPTAAGRPPVAVTGHRPPELGGYDPDNPVAKGVRDKLTEILAAKRVLHPDLGVLTGLGLGAEQLAAEAAIAADTPFVAVLPYPDPDGGVAGRRRRHFRQLLDQAASFVLLEAKQPATKQLAGAALRRRDAWLARHAHEAIVVWDGQDAPVGRTVRALQDALGEDEVWVVTPPAG